MNLSQCISVLATIGQIVLTLIALARVTKSPLARPLAILCCTIAGWTGASVLYELTNDPAFSWFDRTLSPISAPLVFDFVLVFVGARRSSSGPRLGAWLVCGSLSVASSAAFLVPSARYFVASHWWATWQLAGSLPTMAVALFTLFRHLRVTTEDEERACTFQLFALFALGTLLGATEDVTEFVPLVPALGPLGMLLCGLGVTLVTFRFRLFGQQVPMGWTTGVAILAVTMVFFASMVLRVAGPNAILVLFGTLIIALGIVAFARERIARAAARTERIAQLTTLGRFSAQMAHDINNPLAALKSAAQILQAEAKQQGSTIDREQFVELMLAQIARLQIIVERYGRLSRFELVRERVSLNRIVNSVLMRQSLAMPDPITVHTELDPSLPVCAVDVDMFATVLENLVRNAVEAMPDGGTLTVRTAPARRPNVIETTVTDTGIGMDARTRERAVEDFFTTKATGSGLGLAFARRVLEAHGGTLDLTSAVGRGTTIRCRLPSPISEGAT